MQLDSATVILFALFVKVLLAGLFFSFLLRSRRSIWFAWWGATFALGSLSATVFLVGGFEGNLFSAGVGPSLLLFAFGCCWQGVRAFEGKRPLWLALFAFPAVWFAACLVPGFLDNLMLRVLLSSLLLAPLIALSGIEFWRGLDEPLPSRWLTGVLFFSFAALLGIRVPLLNVAPFPFGALPPEPLWMAAFNMLMFFHTVVLAILLVALSKERHELEQRTAADTDPLTGVWNRRALISRGERLLARHERDGEELCLLFLDLDDFKMLNDRIGHSGGDEVLRSFVEVVRVAIRPGDYLFRIGGEEFCCLLPQTGVMHARTAGERIRQQTERATLDVAGRPVRTTVSLGIASTAISGYDLDRLLRAADEAVYAAKHHGRNRVVVAGAQTPRVADTAA